MRDVLLYLQPLLLAVATAAIPTATAFVVRWLNAHTAQIKNATIRRYVEVLVQAAEAKVTDPVTGPEKKAWVLAQLQKKYPGIPLNEASILIEGILTGIKRAQAPSSPEAP